MRGRADMSDLTMLGPWVRRFLLEHLVSERNLARNTQRSYRDTLTLLIPFVAAKANKAVDRLNVVDVSADLIRLFLAHLEESRQCAITTRNQRLASIHAAARFIAEHSPEHIAWCAQVRSIPFKKTTKTVIPYLEKPEMDALLGAPNRQTPQGRRDYALLLFLYNSGTCADEAAQLLMGDLNFPSSSVRILGKGRKEAPLPALADYPARAYTAHQLPLAGRTGLSQPLWSSDHTLWYPHTGRTLRAPGPSSDAIAAEEAR